MNRWLLAVVLLAVSAHLSLTLPKQKPLNSPTVSISLPANIPSETVEIRYVLIGPFGGYGGYIEPRPSQTLYEIEASTGGKPAQSNKILVYAAGCKFQTIDLDLTQIPNPKERFVCESLPQTSISGEVPAEMLCDNAQMSVHYMAFWANTFFGIKDGAVPDFQLLTTTPDASGHFLIDIPDFSADNVASSYHGGATLSFRLRDSNIAFDLKPERPEFRTESQQLKVLPVYPGGVKFTDPRH